jgi:hypothetical protein
MPLVILHHLLANKRELKKVHIANKKELKKVQIANKM